ncbi:uncharacterized protein LOC134719346 [Mytilus trossulus]|uniref:uncharacterized protein LOC134719346 n=1 Tax=Mytilus trossulus TaxID=6551 RepID=UPI0030072479
MDSSDPVTNITDITETTALASNTSITTPFWKPHDDDSSGHGIKDHTVFVSLVVMGIIVPAIFIFIFTMICIKHRKTKQTRRSTMLLRNGPDIPMDDIPLSIRTNLENGRL